MEGSGIEDGSMDSGASSHSSHSNYNSPGDGKAASSTISNLGLLCHRLLIRLSHLTNWLCKKDGDGVPLLADGLILAILNRLNQRISCVPPASDEGQEYEYDEDFIENLHWWAGDLAACYVLLQIEPCTTACLCNGLVLNPEVFNPYDSLFYALLQNHAVMLEIAKLPEKGRLAATDFIRTDMTTLSEVHRTPHLRALRFLFSTLGEYYPSSSDLNDSEVQITSNKAYAGEACEGVFLGKYKVFLRALTILDRHDSVKIQKRLKHEAKVWKELRHPNVVRFLGICHIDSIQYMTSKWMVNGDILSYLRRNPDADRVLLIAQAADGLGYLHSREPGIVHGDFRASNLLVSAEHTIQITDFAFSQVVAEEDESFYSSPWYRAGNPRWQAPEILDATTFQDAVKTLPSDVFAFGRVVVEIMTEQQPFPTLTDHAVVIHVSKGKEYERPKGDALKRGLDNELWDIVQWCCRTNPMERPRMLSVVSLIWGIQRPSFKRAQLLRELVSSERTYAAELALGKKIYTPIAKGEPMPFQILASPRANPRASRSFQAGMPSPVLPKPIHSPMSAEDAHIIFANAPVLADFAISFLEGLERAATSEDRVGRFFLDQIPKMQPLYTAYITRHPSALSHLVALTSPATPALGAYLQFARTLISQKTHIPDLPTLLRQPVQRFLKYSSLLRAIIEVTPEDHPDKADLQSARQKLEELAREMNNQMKGREAVQNVFQQEMVARSLRVMSVASAPLLPSEIPRAHQPHPRIISRIRSIHPRFSTSISKDDPALTPIAEMTELQEWEARINACDKAVRSFFKGTVEWCSELSLVLEALRAWVFQYAWAMGDRSVYVTGGQFRRCCDAIALFRKMQVSMDARLRKEFEPGLTRLLNTLTPALVIIRHTMALQRQHNGAPSTPRIRSAPLPGSSESSSFSTLQTHLRHELPIALKLFERGFALFVMEFAHMQRRFWVENYQRWKVLTEELSETKLPSANGGLQDLRFASPSYRALVQTIETITENESDSSGASKSH
ncbi:hypothetical protein BOTBODRAFT_184208 [Botryobasidium botryosum FD-172 SS1]|uniref:Uncharacterized protein n=1 Tax=Botryobasidium botryosum (strain FD-172 SS1) TaxID=930990 RepID=A0A067MXB3_BOTB1|nr:hypothetical protein BOTBODRAFT_184208 [Botryobasidium botryosum FD-172 SS1]